MRFQKVSVDVWTVIVTSGSCLLLAFIAWVFLKLAYACVWLPEYLKKQEEQMEGRLEDLEQTAKDQEEEEPEEQEEKEQQLKKDE